MDLQTLNFAAATHQQDPRLIEIGLRAAGVTAPALVLNGKRYHKTADILEAVVWLARQGAEAAAERSTRTK